MGNKQCKAAGTQSLWGEKKTFHIIMWQLFACVCRGVFACRRGCLFVCLFVVVGVLMKLRQAIWGLADPRTMRNWPLVTAQPTGPRSFPGMVCCISYTMWFMCHPHRNRLFQYHNVCLPPYSDSWPTGANKIFFFFSPRFHASLTLVCIKATSPIAHHFHGPLRKDMAG